MPRVAIAVEYGELMDLLDLPGTLAHVQTDELRNRLLLVIEHPDLPDNDWHDSEPRVVDREYLHDLDDATAWYPRRDCPVGVAVEAIPAGAPITLDPVSGAIRQARP